MRLSYGGWGGFKPIEEEYNDDVKKFLGKYQWVEKKCKKVFFRKVNWDEKDITWLYNNEEDN